MRFRILLWLLGRMLAKASRTNPDFGEQLQGKDLAFSLFTLDGRLIRSYQVQNGCIRSHFGSTAEPDFTIGFADAATGYEIMTAKNKQLAFMQGIQNKSIKIEGNTAQVIWFQGLFKYLRGKKKQPQK